MTRMGGPPSFSEIYCLRKLNEARHLGLYYQGSIPYGESIENIGIELYNKDPKNPKKSLLLKTLANPYRFDATTDKLTNSQIPLIGNYLGIQPGVMKLNDTQKLYYYEFIKIKYRPPLKESIKLLYERNRNYLITILSKLTSNKNSDNSLINLIDYNAKLSKVFIDIYPPMMVLDELITYQTTMLNDPTKKNVENMIDEIIDNINKYNSHILLYYYLMNKDKLYKIPKFNYYEIPKIAKAEGKFLYFDDDKNQLNLDYIDNTPIIGPESTIPDNINNIVISNKGLSKFRQLLRNINNNMIKDSYIIKKESLIRSKSTSLPPAISGVLKDFYKYNLILLLKEKLDEFKNNRNDPLFNKIETLKNTIDITNNDVITFFTIGKIIQELISEHCKDYVQKQSFRIISKLIKKIKIDNGTPIEQIILTSEDSSVMLNNTNLDLNTILANKLDDMDIYQFSKKNESIDDNMVFIIYPDEYANSELLVSKYKLTLNHKIFNNLLENDVNPYILDLNNQSAIYPILKIHDYSVIKELKKYIDYRDFENFNVINFLIEEYNNHSFLLNNKHNKYNEWLSNFVSYQKNEVKTLILSNDKFGNNVPNYLEDSFEVVFYLTNQYISESINKMNTSDNLDKIKTEFNYDISFNNYLFMNEKASDLNVYENEQDNFLNDLIKNNEIEIDKIKKSVKKLTEGNTKKSYNDKIDKLNNDINEFNKLLIRNKISKKNLNKTKILERYKELDYKKGTMTITLSKLVKSNINNSQDLLIFKIYEKEKDIVNNLKKINDINLQIPFYEHTNNLSEIYFTFGNYCETNKVLKFSKELLIFMTEHFIIFPYIMILKKMLYGYFQSIYPNFTFSEINKRVEYCFTSIFETTDKLDDYLYQVISKKFVDNSIRKFNNSNEEAEFKSENINEILDGVINLLTINPLMPIPNNSKFITNMKEVNAYFDTFVPKTILNWLVVIENTYKFNINQGRIIQCINNLIFN